MTAEPDAGLPPAPTGASERPESHLVPRRVDAVIFDLGNVLITWDPHPAIAKVVGAEQATRFLADEEFDFTAWNHQQDAGRPWGVGEQAAVASHPHWAAAIRAYRSHFGESLVGAIADTVQILRELDAAGVPLYAMTNWSGEMFPVALSRFDFLGLFEDIIVSGEEGVAKPDPKIFEILQRRIGHSLDACVFIDDGPPDIEACSPWPSCTSASDAMGPWLDRYPSNSGPVRCRRSKASSSTPVRSISDFCQLDARITELERLRDQLDSCIGCGCLSLRCCHLYNRRDEAAQDGRGARWQREL
jgi:2-haloacid dehalogenase